MSSITKSIKNHYTNYQTINQNRKSIALIPLSSSASSSSASSSSLLKCLANEQDQLPSNNYTDSAWFMGKHLEADTVVYELPLHGWKASSETILQKELFLRKNV